MDELIHAYTCFVEGSVPRPSSVHVAMVMISSLRRQEPCGDSWELTGLGLSLLRDIGSGVLSQSLPADALFSWGETLKLLLEDMDLISQLVHLFRTQDQLISHLAASAASFCVFYQLHQSEKLHPVWQEKCVQVFQSSAPGPELDAFLWSLTDIFKKLLKGAHQELLGRLVVTFDCSLRAFFEKLLCEKTEELSGCWQQRWATTLCLLLDLLEVLTASSQMCGSLTSYSMTQTHWSALLTVVSCSSQYFVKKKTLLLLKRAVCQRAGEDWSVGRVSSTRLECDARELAKSVLTAVEDNWLQSVQVKAAAFFGGTQLLRGGQRADEVMLRAVSLLLLKSMELHVQTEAAVCKHLQYLWLFLRQHSPLLTNVTHLCSWISLLFADQDDDLMEAHHTSLCIFLRFRRGSVLNGSACATGFNPHCHFILLLQSICFDHSILLDFLISSETCFLEYLVHYLKYLKEDWQGFTATCGGPGYCSPMQLSATGFCALKHANLPDADGLGSCIQPLCGDPPVGGSVSAVGHRLVAYDSSDESESESEAEAEASTAMNQEADGGFASITQKEKSAASLTEADSTSEGVPEGSSTHKHGASAFRREVCHPVEGPVLCLSELREVLTRLQRKKLFPYNPSSLLKLLAQVLNCYQHSETSQ